MAPTPLDEPDRRVLQVVFAGGSEAAWRAGTRGLSARDLAMNVALPEVDGRVLSRAVAFKTRRRFDPATESCASSASRRSRTGSRFTAELAAPGRASAPRRWRSGGSRSCSPTTPTATAGSPTASASIRRRARCGCSRRCRGRLSDRGRCRRRPGADRGAAGRRHQRSRPAPIAHPGRGFAGSACASSSNSPLARQKSHGSLGRAGGRSACRGTAPSRSGCCRSATWWSGSSRRAATTSTRARATTTPICRRRTAISRSMPGCARSSAPTRSSTWASTAIWNGCRARRWRSRPTASRRRRSGRCRTSTRSSSTIRARAAQAKRRRPR